MHLGAHRRIRQIEVTYLLEGTDLDIEASIAHAVEGGDQFFVQLVLVGDRILEGTGARYATYWSKSARFKLTGRPARTLVEGVFCRPGYRLCRAYVIDI
jgi:hypothetical protein